MSEFEREIGKVTNASLVLSRGSFLDVSISFKYEGGWNQCLGGYWVDAIFLYRLMRSFGVEDFKDIVGKYIYVTHSHNGIVKLEPIIAEEGHSFDVRKWSAWLKSKPDRNLSVAEIDKLDFS